MLPLTIASVLKDQQAILAGSPTADQEEDLLSETVLIGAPSGRLGLSFFFIFFLGVHV